MPTLTITKTYLTGNVLTETDLDNIKNSIETFINTTKLDGSNIQTSAIADTIGSAMGATGSNAIAAAMTTTGVTSIVTTLTATNANSIASKVTATGGDAIGSVMTATGANAIAAVRSRATGTTVSAGGIAISASSGTFNTTSTSYVDATNLSVTITTSGRPIRVDVVPLTGASGSFMGIIVGGSGGTSSARGAQFTILNSTSSTQLGTVIISANLAANAFYNVPPFLSVIDTSGAGTYTFKLQCCLSSGYVDTTCEVRQLKLVAYEL